MSNIIIILIYIINTISLLGYIIYKNAQYKKQLQLMSDMHHSSIKSEKEKAIKQSKAVIKGQVAEHIFPLLEGFPYNSSEIRFSGQPIDYIVFNNMESVRMGDTEAKISIIFADVKTNTASLTHVQKAIKNALDNNRVRFETWKLDNNNKLSIK